MTSSLGSSEFPEPGTLLLLGHLFLQGLCGETRRGDQSHVQKREGHIHSEWNLDHSWMINAVDKMASKCYS